jgi:hypothetical protein
MEHLIHMIEEYMSCYLLIGFSLEDEQVVIHNASNSKDEAAIAELLRNTFLNYHHHS